MSTKALNNPGYMKFSFSYFYLTEHGCNQGIKKEVSRYETQVTNRCGVSSVVIN